MTIHRSEKGQDGPPCCRPPFISTSRLRSRSGCSPGIWITTVQFIRFSGRRDGLLRTQHDECLDADKNTAAYRLIFVTPLLELADRQKTNSVVWRVEKWADLQEAISQMMSAKFQASPVEAAY